MLAVDAVQKANSGHPGLPMEAAPIAHVLWTRFMRYNPRNPDWPNRDRFVLSGGHGSMLLYAMLHLTGYDLPLDEIRNSIESRLYVDMVRKERVRVFVRSWNNR